MEELGLFKQQSYYKPSRMLNSTTSPDGKQEILNRTDGIQAKKNLALTLEGSTIAMKSPQGQLKASSSLSKDGLYSPGLSLSANKSVTSQIVRSIVSKTQNLEPGSNKRSNEKGNLFDKTLKVLMQAPLEERVKTLGINENPRVMTEEYEFYTEQNNGDDGKTAEGVMTRRVQDMAKFGSGRGSKLPFIRQAMRASEEKNKRKAATDKRSSGMAGSKGDLEIHSINVNRKLFENQSLSPMKNNVNKGRPLQLKITSLDPFSAGEKPKDISYNQEDQQEEYVNLMDKTAEDKPHLGAELRGGDFVQKQTSNLLTRSAQKGGYHLFAAPGATQETLEDEDLNLSMTVNAVKIKGLPDKGSSKKLLKEKREGEGAARRSMEVRKSMDIKAVDAVLMYNHSNSVKGIKGKDMKLMKREDTRIVRKNTMNSLQDISKVAEDNKTEGLYAWENSDNEKSLAKDDDDEEEDGEDAKEEEVHDNKKKETSLEPAGGNERFRLREKTYIRSGKNVGVKELGAGNIVKITKKPINEKDEASIKREQAYKAFMQKMNFSFNIVVKVPVEKTFTTYKYYLGKGNNSIMLKAMMKTRWWWIQSENKDAADLNFMWTQIKNNQFISTLKPRRKTPFEGLENSGVSSTHYANESTINSATAIDSATDCESDTTESETKSTSMISRTRRAHTTLKTPTKSKERSTNKGIRAAGTEFDEDAAMKKLFTNHEIMLMSTLNGKKNVYPEDYEELGKLKKGPAVQVVENANLGRMCNHLENNFHLANKKALLWNMKSYYEAVKKNVFDHLPLTFHVRNGLEDKEYLNFVEYYQNRENEIKEQERVIQETMKETGKKSSVKKLRNLWIVKPGENTNRGVGITVCNELSQIRDLISKIEGEEEPNGRKRTYLIQQYLDRPLLYNKRKFDIRCYILVTCINGTMKGYWYQEGYIRTASKEFSLKNVTNRLIHLTNDAVQKKAEDYGKFEAGNKLSYNDFQKYLDSTTDGKVNFNNDIYPQIRNLAIDAIKGVYGKMDPHRRENQFEVFGLDFMIDQSLRAWLIEVNTNPDINASSPALTRVIPNMVENALRLTIDQMYPPPVWHMNKKNALPENLLENNKFELVFDEVEDGPALRAILNPEKGVQGDMLLEIVAEEEEEEMENEEEKD